MGSRIVAALEGTYLMQFRDSNGNWPFFPWKMLDSWNWALILATDLAEDPNKNYGPEYGIHDRFLRYDSILGRELKHSEAGPLVGRGLEAWSDAKLAAKFTREYLAEYADPWSAYDNETNMYDTYAWASDWQDRAKADAFVAEMEEIWVAETGNEHYDYYNDY